MASTRRLRLASPLHGIGRPLLDVRDDHVAAGAVVGRVNVIDEVEIEDAVVAVSDERESVVIAVDVEACGLIEADGVIHVHDGECGCHVEHAAGLRKPADARPADADVLMALQCSGFGFVSRLSAARAGQHRLIPERNSVRRHHGPAVARRVERSIACLRFACHPTHVKQTPTSGCLPSLRRRPWTVRSPQHQHPAGGSGRS